MEDVYLIEGARTAFTAFTGSFATVSATQLGTVTAVEALKRSKVALEDIDAVFYGNVIATGKDAAYTARHIALLTGLPEEVPALTLNRLCGSGLQSVISGAQEIQLGESQIVLAGGTENMSQAPFSNFEQRSQPSKMGNIQFEDMLQATLTDQYTGMGMGMTAENLAEKYAITREQQDAYAVLSHERAAASQQADVFAREIVPVQVPTRKGTRVIEQDEQIRPDTTVEQISQLQPVFKRQGTVTAANASSINDGAASIVLASGQAVEEKGLQPLAKIISYAAVGVDPNYMGIGPVSAIKRALVRANLTSFRKKSPLLKECEGANSTNE